MKDIAESQLTILRKGKQKHRFRLLSMTMQLLKLVTMHESDNKMSAHAIAVLFSVSAQAGSGGHDARAATAQDPHLPQDQLED